jgi:acetyl-CoA C-acetyltransferase
MSCNVAIIGIGYTPFRPLSPDVSYKEMIYEAAVKSYHDANLGSHRDIDGFVTCAEDFHEGTSIFDEYTPDQLGAVQKPVHTICGDTLHGLAAAVLKIKTGLMDIVVVESHSKASNIKTYGHILNYAIEPTLNRPLNLHPYYIAGLEMQSYLHRTKTTEKQCAAVVVKNKRNALKNELSSFGAELTEQEVLKSDEIASPLKRLEISPHVDGAAVFVLAADKTAKKLSRRPVWIKGIGWNSDSPTLETRNWTGCSYAKRSALDAYRQAKIKNPKREIDFFEIDDTFAYKELLHLEAIGVYKPGTAGQACIDGKLDRDGKTPVNVSGGTLGLGHALDASGALRVIEIVKQLRGEAGKRQLKRARSALALSWRGIPTTSGAVAIFGLRGN